MEVSPYIANLLIPFCEAASVNCRLADATLLKRIIVSFAFINTEQLHEILFPQQHIDWMGLKQYLQDVHYSTQDWIHLINLIDFHNEIHPDQATAELVSSTLAGIKVSVQGKALNPIDSLRLCFAKGGVSPTWDTLCKALVLFNLVDIDNTIVLEYLLANVAENNAIQEIIKNMPNLLRHTPNEYVVIFSHILNVNENCHIRAHHIIQSLKCKEEIQEKKKISNQQVFTQNSKPSLTRILEMQQQKQTLDSDSFVSFCDTVHLHSNQNMHLKRLIYFLKCTIYAMPQHKGTLNVYEPKYIPRLVSNDQTVLDAICNIDIVTPDVFSIKRFLAETYYSGTPFTALKQFRHAFFQHMQNGSVHWSTIFRLYIAIYCKPEIIKDLWIYIGGLCENSKSVKLFTSSDSHENIQAFVAENPMALDETLEVLLSHI